MATLANPDLTPLKRDMEAAMADLRARIGQVSRERGKVASGSTLNSITYVVTAYPGALFARAEANDNWKFVGNGRAPGGMPPVQRIQDWINAKGLTISAWAVALKIKREGSADYRAKRTNVFEDAIVQWQGGPSLDRVMNAAGDLIGDLFTTDVQQALR